MFIEHEDIDHIVRSISDRRRWLQSILESAPGAKHDVDKECAELERVQRMIASHWRPKPGQLMAEKAAGIKATRVDRATTFRREDLSYNIVTCAVYSTEHERWRITLEDEDKGGMEHHGSCGSREAAEQRATKVLAQLTKDDIDEIA